MHSLDGVKLSPG